MEQLNGRQLDLYNFLEAMGDQWTPQKDIADALMWWYPLYDENKFHDSNARMLMTKDIQAINESNEVQKVIISGNRGIKIANREEFSRYIKRQYSSVFRRLKRIRAKERKGQLDGQSYFVYETEQDVINAFLQEN